MREYLTVIFRYLMYECLTAIRRDLFDGEITPYEYDCTVKSFLRAALAAKSIDYKKWTTLYCEFVG